MNVKQMRSPPMGWKGKNTGLVVASYAAPSFLEAAGGSHLFELIRFGAEGLISGVVLDVVNEGAVAGIASEVPLCAVDEYNHNNNTTLTVMFEPDGGRFQMEEYKDKALGPVMLLSRDASIGGGTRGSSVILCA